MERHEEVIDILLPVHNVEPCLHETLASISIQTHPHFRLLISNNASEDQTLKVIQDWAKRDGRIKYWNQNQNIGYQANLAYLVEKSQSPLAMLMAGDDILHPQALEVLIDPFRDPTIYAVTRPYFWFFNDPTNPVRAKRKMDSWPIRVDSTSPNDMIVEVLRTIDQLSGLVFRRDALEDRVTKDVFTAHSAAFLWALANHAVTWCPEYRVAVRIEHSHSRLSGDYEQSPVQTWVSALEQYLLPSLTHPRHVVREFCGHNALGLLQIRNYARHGWRKVVREALLMLRLRPKNAIDPQFIAVFTLCLVTPRRILRPLTNWTRNRINRFALPRDITKDWPLST